MMLARAGWISATLAVAPLLLALLGCQVGGGAVSQPPTGSAAAGSRPSTAGCPLGHEVVSFNIAGSYAPMCLPQGLRSDPGCPAEGIDVVADDGRHFCFLRWPGPGCPPASDITLPPTTYQGRFFYTCRVV